MGLVVTVVPPLKAGLVVEELLEPPEKAGLVGVLLDPPLNAGLLGWVGFGFGLSVVLEPPLKDCRDPANEDRPLTPLVKDFRPELPPEKEGRPLGLPA